ncbi:MAG: hypothetical protein ACR2OE_01740 [Thermomicrobiales bacterium]
MAALRKTSAPVVKLKPGTHAKLQELSKFEDRPMGEIVTELIDRYEDEVFWQRYEESLAKLHADPVAWQEYQNEIRLFEGAKLDRLIKEEAYFTPEEEEALRVEHATHTPGG